MMSGSDFSDDTAARLGVPRLPVADHWDSQTGVQPIADFKVECKWTPISEDWALVQTRIHLHDGVYKLCKDAEVMRVYSERSQGKVEAPELSALAWTKRAVGSGGVHVLGMYESGGGHSLHPEGYMVFRWAAQVGSRLSVAVVRLDGNLAGQVRLVPVE